MMKRFLTATVALALAALLAFGFAGCSKKKKQNGAADNGHHDVTITETDDYLVRDASSDYRIVIGENADDAEVAAARELQGFFEEATQIALPIDRDAGLTYSADAKYISVGRTTLASSAGVEAKASEIKEEGYRLVTKGKTIFLLGASTVASIYAVYDFLHYEVGFEYFFTDVYSLRRGVADLRLKNYDVTEVPDIDELTTPSIGHMMNDLTERRRFRVSSVSDWLVSLNGATDYAVHNVFIILPQATYKAEHPSWYIQLGNLEQICFNGFGNYYQLQVDAKRQEIEAAETDEEKAALEAELDGIMNEAAGEKEALFQAIADVIKNGLMTSDGNVFSISLPDNSDVCTCEKCRADREKYGANSSTLILLLNRLSDYFENWFAGEGAEYKRDLKFVFLAYQQIIDPPNESEDMKCRDNVGVYFAPDTFWSTYGIDETEINRGILENMKKWQNFTSVFMYWIYDVNFNHYFIPYDSFYSKPDLYKFMADAGTIILNDQSQTQNRNGGTAWANLKSYLSTKLRWNVNADLTALTDEFFATCYLDGADEMMNVYLQYKAHYRYMKSQMEAGAYSGITSNNIGNIFAGLSNPALWPYRLVKGWYDEMEKALGEVAAKKDSDPQYQKAYNMIAAEIASPIYMLITMHADEFSEADLESLKQEFKTRCTEAGLLSYMDSSTRTIQTLYDELGIV